MNEYKLNKKERWKHYRKEHTYSRGDKAICGKMYKGWRNTVFVHTFEETTCPRCIEQLKIDNYYCKEHGFINDIEVTFDETCTQCGLLV